MPFFVFDLEFAERPLGVRIDGRVVTIGRSKSEDLVLPDASVEAHHATLRKRGKDYLITSEASEGETSLVAESGERIALGENIPRVITSGERLLLGEVRVRIHLVLPSEDVEWIEATDLPRVLVGRALAHFGHPAEKKDIDAALRELLGARAKTPKKKRMSGTASPRAEPLRETSEVLLIALLIALALSALALYWLLLPDTPRSL